VTAAAQKQSPSFGAWWHDNRDRVVRDLYQPQVAPVNERHIAIQAWNAAILHAGLLAWFYSEEEGLAGEALSARLAEAADHRLDEHFNAIEAERRETEMPALMPEPQAAALRHYRRRLESDDSPYGYQMRAALDALLYFVARQPARAVRRVDDLLRALKSWCSHHPF